MSEISALQREREHTFVNPAGVLVLKPGHGFLAKNKDSCILRDAWRVPPRTREDKVFHSVATIQAYCNRTAETPLGV